MSTINRIGWVILLFLAGLSFGMAIAVHVRAAAPSLVDRLVVAQGPLQSRRDPSVDPRELAEAIGAIPKVTPTWAALILTIAAHETALSAPIARGECRPKECDGGRAWGLYQGHKNTLNAAVWGSPDISVQTLEAARALRSAFYQCGGLKHADWPVRTMRAYGTGRGCELPLPDEGRRLATFNRLRATLLTRRPVKFAWPSWRE